MQKIIDLISDQLNLASLNDKPEVADALANGEHTLVSGEGVLERLAAAMREPRPTFFLITA